MVGSIVSTSAWSHNCGMHVIADFLSEKLQQDDFKKVFTGEAYDKLLKSFQNLYKQEKLTWENIRESSAKRNKTDLQIIWGYALRMMLPAVAEKNQEYKKDLYNSFLAAINLFKEGKSQELQTTYPIIFSGCEEYFQGEALNYDVNPDKYLSYWNEKGFKNYCSALVQITEGNKSFSWLSKEELSIFCQYFKLEFEFVDQLGEAANLDPKKLYFSNSTETHWERKVASSQLAPVPAVLQANSDFHEQFLTKDAIQFLLQANVLGEIFFSDLYSDIKLALDLYQNIQDDELRSCLIRKDKQALRAYAISNKDQQKINNLLEFAIVYFDYKEAMYWFRGFIAHILFHDFYAELLLGTVKYKKQAVFNQLLTDFPKEYSPSACMPALILAAKQNNHEIAHQLLSRPGFDTSGYTSKAISYVKPAFSHILNQFDENGTPALYYAVKNIDIPLAKMLLEKGACATYEVNGRVAFEWALDTSNLDMIDLIINTVSPSQLLSLYNHQGNNYFHLFFKNKALGERLNKWIEVYLNDDHHNALNEILNAKNSLGQNIFHLSAVEGYLEGIEYCLEHQMSLFSQDATGNTALHLAVAYGQLEAVKLLVSAIQKSNNQATFDRNKFDFNQKNKNKMSPLHLAQDNNHIEVARYLKSIGCTDWVNDAYTELYLLCQQDKPDFDTFCLNNKDKLNIQGSEDFTLLHFVCFLSHTKPHTQTIIKKLLEHGAKHNTISYQGASPLHLAASYNNVDAIEALLAQGAFINAINYQGMTACHYAADSDAKDAFMLLKNKGANLDLPAFAAAGIDAEPLTAIYLAGQLNGKIAAYLKLLNPLKTENVSDKSKVKFHSFEHRGIHWVENKLGMNHHYISNLCSELHGLEGMSTYQFLSMLKVAVCVGGAAMIGPSAAGIELAKQSILYATPTVKQKAGQFYYYIKPGIHNYNLYGLSKALDTAAASTGYAYDGLFKLMNYCDLGNNFGRRVAGGAVGIGGLKIAQKFGAEREAQAAALFLARELGYLMVDAYHATSPERKAQQAWMQYHVNPTLNQAYEIWGSILGKTLAEILVQTAQFAVESKANFYQTVGESERAVLDSIEGYVDLRNHLSNTIDFVFNNRVSQSMLAPPQMLRLEAELMLNAISEKTNSVLLGLEKFIHTHLVPESEYQCMMLKYAYTQKGLLTQNLKHQAEIQLKQAIESDNQQNIAYYKEVIKNYEQDIAASEQLANQYYEQTAKGKIANQYYAEQHQNFESWSDARDFDNLKNLDPELYFDQAYASLGETISPEKFYQYLVSVFQMKNITVDDKAWESFKLTLDATKMKDADFKQNLKSHWSTFAKAEIQNHITEATHDAPTSLDNSELEKLINDFKPLATPEELRVLELNQKIEVKIYQYDLFLEQKEHYIKEQALMHSKYADFIQANIQYEQAESDWVFAQADLDHLEFKINNEFEVIKNNPTLTPVQKEKWIAAYNEKLDDARLMAQEKKEILSQKKTLLENSEGNTSKELTLAEKYHFKLFSTQTKKNSDTSNQYLQTETQKILYDDKYEFEMDEKQKTLEDLNNKMSGLEQLNNFEFNYQLMYKLVSLAFDKSENLSSPYKIIMEHFEKVLPFDLEFIKKNIELSKDADNIKGNGSGKNKKSWAKTLCKQFKIFQVNHIVTKKASLSNEIKVLKNKISVCENNLSMIDDKRNQLNQKMALLEDIILDKASPEAKQNFQDRKLNRKPSNGSKNQDADALDLRNPAKTIDPIIDQAFKDYEDRNPLAEYITDMIMKWRDEVNYQPETKAEKSAYREKILHEVSTYELSGYKRNTQRSKDRIYDYIYAKITGTEKKPHRHRWERIIKPMLNEIMAELTGGYRPYKDFKGGEDKKGQFGLQLTWQTDGRITLGIQQNNVPVWTLYDSAEPKRIIPEFSQPVETKLETPKFELRKPATIPVATPAQEAAPAHAPSLANTVLQNGLLEQSSSNFPGPLLPEHLPKEIKNPTAAQTFVPLGYQNTNKQPDIVALPEEQQQPKTISETSDNQNQQNSNMVNHCEGQAHAQPIQSFNSEQLLSFLPNYNKLMHPEANELGEAPQSFPGPLRPELLPEKVKNPTAAQIFVPLGHQDTKQPTIPLRPEGQSIPESAKIVSPTQHKPQKPAQTAVQSKPPKSSSSAAKPDLPKPQPESKPAPVALEAKKPAPLLLSQPLQGFGYNPFLFQSKLNDISPTEFAHLAREAFGEYRQEFADDLKVLQREMLLGPGANITKISLTIGKYFGAELAHLFKNEKTQSRLFIEATKANFNSLDEKSQIKEVLKLGYSVVMPGTTAAAMGKAGILFKKINKLTNKAPITPDLPKSRQSLGELASKQQNLPKTSVSTAVSSKMDEFSRTMLTAPSHQVPLNSFTSFVVRPPSFVTLYNQQQLSRTRKFKSIEIKQSTPAEIYYQYGDLSKRQKWLLEKLPSPDSIAYVKKSNINVRDLASLTAKTGDEFAIFTLGSQRIILRGNPAGVAIRHDLLNKFTTEKWRWSAHTHPGRSDIALNASGIPGDRDVLNRLNQDRSLIVNSTGRRNVFDKQDNQLVNAKTEKNRNQKNAVNF